MTTTTDLERSTYQRRPAYRYIRTSDKLPTYEELGDRPLTEITATVKLFNPTGGGTWHLAAYDPDTRDAWGVCDLGHGFTELGFVSMAELVPFRGRFGLPIERDLYYSPVSLAVALGSA